MNLEYGDCLKKGKIKPFSRGSALASKEFEAAVSDLGRAKKTFEEDDYYNRWSEAGCEKLLNAAEAFLKKVKEIISKTK